MDKKHYDFKLCNGKDQIGTCKARPVLSIKELTEEIGGTIITKPGEHRWLPMDVELTEFWLGKLDLFLRIYRGATLCETWSLLGCQRHLNQIYFDSVYYIPNDLSGTP